MAATSSPTMTARMSPRQWIWWYMLEIPCYLWITIAYRFRSWGATRIPRRGAVLFVANHQSYLDPILLGVAGHHRPFYAMARASLFKHRFFAWLIGTLRAIPIEQQGSDLAAMRRCMDVLRRGATLLVFPEGARTLDGSVAAFSPGTIILIKRTRPIVVPVAIDGAYAAWPRGGRLRGRGRIGVLYGDPIGPDELLALSPDEALRRLETGVEALRHELGRRLRSGSECK